MALEEDTGDQLDLKYIAAEGKREVKEEEDEEERDDLTCKVCTLLIQPPMFRCSQCHDLYHQGCLPGNPDLFAIRWLYPTCDSKAPSTSIATSVDPVKASPSSPTRPPSTRHKKKQKQARSETS